MLQRLRSLAPGVRRTGRGEHGAGAGLDGGLADHDAWRLCNFEAFDETLFVAVSAAEVLSGCGRHFRLPQLRPAPPPPAELAASPRGGWPAAESVAHHVSVLRAAVKGRRLLPCGTSLGLDYFLSHSWRAGRWMQCWGLALFLNGPAAVAAGYVVMIAAFPLSVVLPVVNRYSVSAGSMVTYGPWCTVLGLTACGVFLVAGQRIRETLRMRPHAIFFDRLCIRQDDPEKKRAGVRMLGCFIAMSRVMIVAMDETYWDRLWCIFELALFARVRGRYQITFVSPELSFSTVAMCATQVFASGVQCVEATVFHDYGYVHKFVIMTLVNLGVIPLACGHIRRTKKLCHRLKNFTLNAASCSVQEDRQFIYGRIEACFDSVAIFECYVRRELHVIVEEHLFLHGRLSLCGVLLVSLPTTCRVLDCEAGFGLEWRLSRAQLANRILYVFTIGPSHAAFWTTMFLLLARLAVERRRAARCGARVALDLGLAVVMAGFYELPFFLSPSGSPLAPVARLEGHGLEPVINASMCLAFWAFWRLPMQRLLGYDKGQTNGGGEGSACELAYRQEAGGAEGSRSPEATALAGSEARR